MKRGETGQNKKITVRKEIEGIGYDKSLEPAS
jgi:hypothetical protein